jgi:hypothetical protein
MVGRSLGERPKSMLAIPKIGNLLSINPPEGFDSYPGRQQRALAYAGMLGPSSYEGDFIRRQQQWMTGI